MWQFTTLLVAGLGYAAVAHPSYLPPYEHVEYAPTVVGHSVHSVPTAVSHQSQTIVHEKRPYLRPIVEHAPLLQTYGHPIVKSYAPVVKTYDYEYEPTTSVAWPGASYGHASPYSVYSGLYDHGWNPSAKAVYGHGWNPSAKAVYGDWNPSTKAVYGDWNPGWKASYGDWNGWPLK